MTESNCNHDKQQPCSHQHHQSNDGGNKSEENGRRNSSSNNNNRRQFKKKTRGYNNNSNKKNNNLNDDNNVSNHRPRKKNSTNINKTSASDIRQRIRICKTLMEVIQLQRKENRSLKPSHLSFYWNQIARLICANNTNKKTSSSSSMDSCLQRLKRNPTLLKSLVGQTIRYNSALNPRSLAFTAHAIAKISYKMRKSIIDSDKLWELLERNIIQKATSPKDNFSSQECANICWSFAKEFGGQQQQKKMSFSDQNTSLLFDAMINQLSHKLHLCNAQDIANTVWACATVHHPAPALFDAMIPTAIEKLDEFNSQNLANTVWAYTTVRHPAPDLFDAVAATLTVTATMSDTTNSNSENKISTFNSQAIANTVWSYATKGHYTANSKIFLDALATLAISKLDSFNSQELAITLWGYATLNHYLPELFDAILHLAIQKLPSFKSQEIANTVWAYATMGHSAPELFNSISQLLIERIEIINSQAIITNAATHGRVGYPMGNLSPKFSNNTSSSSTSSSTNKIDNFSSQAIANTVWAYATAGHTDARLFDAMSQLALLKLLSFNSQEIANTMRAYATVNHPAPDFFDAVSNLAVSKINRFNTQELVNTMWAFATLSHPAPEFFNAVSNLAISGLHNFNSQELANTIWAYATVYHYGVNPQVINGILWEATQKREFLKSEQIVTILWSMAVLNSIDTQSVMPLFSEISKRYYSSPTNFRLSREALSQLHQASMWYSEEHRCNESLLPVQLRQECFKSFSSSENILSELQLDVLKTLKSMPSYMGISIIEEEKRCKRTGYSMDALISMQQQQLAIEIDGPSHFVGYTPNGATLLKQRQLCSLGTTLFLSIPYWEWDMLNLNTTTNNNNNNTNSMNNWNSTSNNDPHHNCNGDIKRKQSYLQQRLQQVSFL